MLFESLAATSFIIFALSSALWYHLKCTLWIKQWLALNAVVKSYPEKDTLKLLDEFTWYELPLRYVLSFRGLVYVMKWNLCNFIMLCFTSDYNRYTEKNHGITTFYRSIFVAPEDVSQPKPTCWNIRNASQTPWLNPDHYPCLEIVKKQIEGIRKEFNNNLKNKNLGIHPDTASEIASGKWEWNYLYGVGGKNEDGCKLYPLTTSLIEQLPVNKSFGFVFFSRLAPGTHILPHNGSTSLRHRFHLGLDIPETGTVQIRAGKNWRSWTHGDWLGFDDSYEHEVKHNGQLHRAVLIIDLWRPDLSKTEIDILSSPVLQSFGKKNPKKVIRKSD